MKILLVEDDDSLGETLKERLIKENYEVYWATQLDLAMRFFEQEDPDLMILDVGLPDGSGFDFAERIRQVSSIPFIFVTAQTSAEDRLKGYELGAEEFIPKPFLLRELLLRVKRVIDKKELGEKLVCGDIIVDFKGYTVTSLIGTRDVPSNDLKVLKLLVEKSPAVIGRNAILDEVWGQDKFPSHRTVDNIIVRLRQLLGEQGNRIQTVRGMGYSWSGLDAMNKLHQKKA